MRLFFTLSAAGLFALAIGGCASTEPTTMPSAHPTTPTIGATRIDPTREIVFSVATLGCSLVNGVGCGHLLAPLLSQLDGLEGVSRSYSNWTGTALRITVASNADREAVAGRVSSYLSARQQELTRVNGDELTRILGREEWRGVDRIPELSSYEFHTFARRQVAAFADDEKLDAATRQKLLALVDDAWNGSGEGLGRPKPDADAYASYWQARSERLVQLYAQQARDLLTPEQIDKLITHYRAPTP